MKNVWLFHLIVMSIAIIFIISVSLMINKSFYFTYNDLKYNILTTASQKIIAKSLLNENNLISFFRTKNNKFLSIFNNGIIYKNGKYFGASKNIKVIKSFTGTTKLNYKISENGISFYYYNNDILYNISVYSNNTEIYFLLENENSIINTLNNKNKSIQLYITNNPNHKDALKLVKIDGKNYYIDYKNTNPYNVRTTVIFASTLLIMFFIISIIMTFISQKSRKKLKYLLKYDSTTSSMVGEKLKISKLSGSLYELYEMLKNLTMEIQRKNQELKNINEITKRKKEIIEKLFTSNPEKYFSLDYPEFFDEMLKFILEILPHGEKGSVVVPTENGTFKFIAMKGYNLNSYRKVKLNKNQLFINFTDKNESPIIIKEPMKTVNSGDPLQEKLNISGNLWNLKETLAAPIKIDKNISAIIYIDIFEKTSHFTKEDIELMQYFVAYIGTFLRNKMYYDKIIELSNTDELTKIHNRRYFERIIANEILKTQRYGYKDGILYFDLNDFKEINDTYGHKIGDEALKTFVKYIKKHLRNSDTFARFGGDEFIAILPFIEEEELLKKIEQLKSSPIYVIFENKKIEIRYAVGYSIIPDDGKTVDEVIIKADMKMYEDKLKGKKANLI